MGVIGASPDESELWLLLLLLLCCSLISMNSLLHGLFRRFLGSSSPAGFAGDVVGIFNVPLTETAIAGTVPVPVASIMAGSACSSNQRMVSPSDL